MSQLPLRFGELDRARSLLSEVSKDLAEVADSKQRNVVAPELDISPGYLTKVLSGEKRMPAEILLGLMEYDDSCTALKRIAARHGFSLQRIVTAEEKLHRIAEVMERRLGKVSAEILREALGGDR